jgi:hypothetical protein
MIKLSFQRAYYVVYGESQYLKYLEVTSFVVKKEKGAISYNCPTSILLYCLEGSFVSSTKDMYKATAEIVYYLRLFYFTLNQNNMKLVFKFLRI